MSLKQNQKQVNDWIKQTKIGYWEPLSLMVKITEEVGELAREVNDRHGGRIRKSGKDTEDMGKEIGDIIFALICLANSHNIDLDKSWERVMDKCYDRDKDRYEKK